MDIATTLKTLADKYETKDFLNGDPSWFMHQVEGDKNKEIMRKMLTALQEMLNQHGTIKDFVGNGTCLDALEKITKWFATRYVEGIIPKNTQSSCKRLCMFLRWMVRDESPVDLGIWNDVIDKRTLIIPMDTHVLQEASRLGLLKSKTASMSSAIKLTDKLRKVFPDDPLKGDFALFGVGVNG